MTHRDFLAEMTAPPTHPGEILTDIVLPTLGIDRSEAARRAGMSEPDFQSLLDGELGVSDANARGIGELCGNGPTLWINMQATFDDWMARHRPRPEDGGQSFSSRG